MKDPILFPDIFEASFILVCLFGLQLVFGHVSYYLIGPFRIGDPYITGVISLFTFGIILSWIMHYKNMGYREVFHPSKRPVSELILKVTIPLILVVIGVFVFELEINKILTSIFPMSAYHEELFSNQMGNKVHAIITISFIAPFVEELLFRGIFLRAFLEQYSTRKAIVVSSLMFAIFHLNIYQFFIAFTLGVFSAWIYSMTYSLIPCLLIHFSYNSFCLIYAELQKAYDVFPFSKSMSLIEGLILLTLGIISAIVGVVALSGKKMRINRRGL